MSAQVACPVCKTKYTVADNLLGKTIPCKKCQESFVATAVDDIPTLMAVPDDEAPPPAPAVARSPILLFLAGAGAAAVLLGVIGTAAYLLWPAEPKPAVVQAPPPPAPRPTRPRNSPAPITAREAGAQGRAEKRAESRIGEVRRQGRTENGNAEEVGPSNRTENRAENRIGGEGTGRAEEPATGG